MVFSVRSVANMTVERELYVYSWGSQTLRTVQCGKVFHKGYLCCFATDVRGNVFQVLFQKYMFSASVAFESVGDHPLPKDEEILKFIQDVIRLNNSHNECCFTGVGKDNVHRRNLDTMIKTNSEKIIPKIFPFQNNGILVSTKTERRTTRDASKSIVFFDFQVSTFSQLNSFSELFSLSQCFIGGKEFKSLVNIVPSCQVQFLSKFRIPCTGWVVFRGIPENISCETEQIVDIDGLNPATFVRLMVDSSNPFNIQTCENQSKMPTFRVLSFDIETFSEDGSLPDGANRGDTVFQISCVVSRGVGKETFIIVKRSSCECEFSSVSDVTVCGSDDFFQKSVTSLFLNNNCQDIEMMMHGNVFVATQEEVFKNLSEIDYVKIRCEFQKYLFSIGRGLPADVSLSPVKNDDNVSALMMGNFDTLSSDEDESDDDEPPEIRKKTLKFVVGRLAPEKMLLVVKDDCNAEVRFPSSFTLRKFKERYHGTTVCVNGSFFQLKVTSKDNPNFDSFYFPKQQGLIDGFITFIKRTNPHVMIGYNILQYDLKFLTAKSRHLNLQTWNNLGVSTDPVTFKETYSNSNQKGDQKSMTVYNLNRVIVDMKCFLESEVKLDTYKLNDVANAFLEEQKEDLSPSQIFDSFRAFRSNREDADEKIEVCGSYCVHDSVLVTKLFIKFSTWIKIQEMSRASHSTLEQILHSGQLKRSANCFYVTCERDGFGFVPNKVHSAKEDDDSKYQGATVFKPVSGKYSRVISLDFASLYPSIMIAYNLCVSTLKEKWSPGCFTVAIGNHQNCECSRKSYVKLFGINENPEKTEKPGINSSDVEHQDENISGFRSFLLVFLQKLLCGKKKSDKHIVYVKSFAERCKSNTIQEKIRREMLLLTQHPIDLKSMLEHLDKWRMKILQRQRQDKIDRQDIEMRWFEDIKVRWSKDSSADVAEDQDQGTLRELDARGQKLLEKNIKTRWSNVIRRRLEFDADIFKMLDVCQKTRSLGDLLEKLESFGRSFVYSDMDIKRLKDFKTLFVKEDKDRKVVCVDEQFFFDSVAQSVSSKVLTHLLIERKKAKEMLQVEKLKPNCNPATVQMYDNLQNAFKIMANSVYGSFGSSFNTFGSKSVALCVTALGRFANVTAAAEIKEKWNGRILYGDTDSNYVHFPLILVNGVEVPIETATDDEIVKFAKDVADRVSGMAVFRPPMKLEFENMIYTDILFVSKKRYVFSVIQDGRLIIKSKGLIGARRGLPVIDVSLFHRMESLVFDETKRKVDDIVLILVEEMLQLFQRQLTVVNPISKDIEIDIRKLTFSKKTHVLESFDNARVEAKTNKVMLGKYTIGKPKGDFKQMTDAEKSSFILNGLPEHVIVLHKCQHLRGEVVDSSRIEYVKLDMSVIGRKGTKIFVEKPLERRTAEDSKFFMQNAQKLGLKLDLLKIIERVAKHMDDVLIKAFIRNQELKFDFDNDEDKLMCFIRFIWPSINMRMSTFLGTLSLRHLLHGEMNFLTFSPAIFHSGQSNVLFQTLLS